MDLCSGSELEDLIARDSGVGRLLTAHVVRSMMLQVTMALAHMHGRGVIHLDLKPQNIMVLCRTSRRDVQATLIDLGITKLFKPGRVTSGLPVGTLHFMSPDVLQGHFTPKADTWSLGVTFFKTLSGCLPLPPCYSVVELHRQFQDRREPSWHLLHHCCRDALELCAKLLHYERRARPSMVDVLRDVYMRAPPEKVILPRALATRIYNASQRSILQRITAVAVTKAQSLDCLETEMDFYLRLELAGSGRVTKHDLQDALRRSSDLSHAQLREAAAAMVLDGSVSWTHFAAACLDLADPNLESELHSLFSELDGDGDGFVGSKDFEPLLRGAVDPTSARKELEAMGRDPAAQLDRQDFLRHLRTLVPPRSGSKCASRRSSASD